MRCDVCLPPPCSSRPLSLSAGAAGATTVWPPGDPYSASLSSSALELTAGGLEVSCATSTFEGEIPASPDNEDAGDPITLEVGTPSFDDCDGFVHVFGIEASVGVTSTANDTNGPWQITYDDDGVNPPTADVVVPEDGVEITLSNGCTFSVAPSGAASVDGEWTNGSDSDAAPSSLEFVAASVPIQRTGGSCSSPSSASVTAAYDVLDLDAEVAPVLVLQNPPRAKWQSPTFGTDYAGSFAATGLNVTFEWTFGTTKSITCRWDLSGSVTNATAGTGSVTSGTFSQCNNYTLPFNCTLGTVTGTFPWPLQAYKVGSTHMLRLTDVRFTTPFGGQFQGCSLPASISWVASEARGFTPAWTNGQPGLSTQSGVMFGGRPTGRVWKTTNINEWGTLWGGVSFTTGAPALLLLEQ